VRAAAEHEQQVCEIQGLVEAPMMDNERGECFSPLVVNATSVNVSVYYNKAVNYTLMVTFISFLQVLFLIRQMEHSNTQSGAAKVSLLMVGQQAIMDAYLCLLHLTAGILVGQGRVSIAAGEGRQATLQEGDEWHI
jgi:predicted membrane-bound mannosyltransferase